MATPEMNRRNLLRGAGAALALALPLPFLESRFRRSQAINSPEAPRRLCAVMFPYGVAVRTDRHQERDWCWMPRGEGGVYKFTKVLESLQPLREDITILAGLSHPNCRKMGGHATGDTFLTGVRLRSGQFQNGVSLDQVAASTLCTNTRFSSLVVSSDGGIGRPLSSTTLSYTHTGQPIPALAKPQQIFDRLFSQHDRTMVRRQLRDTHSILDQVAEDASDLHRSLSRADQRKLDQYLTSVRETENRVSRAEKWLDIARPVVSPDEVNLDAAPDGAEEFIRAMYDLIYLAFATDSTRVASYMIGGFSRGVAWAFPQSVGLKGDWHEISHQANNDGGAVRLGKFDRFLSTQFSYFLRRLKETPEGDGNMLDNTLLLYGSSNYNTHDNTNYPLILAGGGKLGFQHGRLRKYTDETPLANLYLTMLQSLGAAETNFADSTATMPELMG